MAEQQLVVSNLVIDTRWAHGLFASRTNQADIFVLPFVGWIAERNKDEQHIVAAFVSRHGDLETASQFLFGDPDTRFVSLHATGCVCPAPSLGPPPAQLPYVDTCPHCGLRLPRTVKPADIGDSVTADYKCKSCDRTWSKTWERKEIEPW